MFKELQNVFRQSMAAFRAELSRREPEDEVAELLGAMRRELTEARAALPLYQQELERSTAALERERELLQQCDRRRAQAERIGDAETVRVATEFAARHQERIAVLERKVEAAEAEWSLRQREAEQMKRAYQEADTRRFALVAELRRARAQQRIRSALDDTDGPFADFSRMAETVSDGAARVDALEELSDAPPPPSPASGAELEERLRELKRRMGKE